MHSASDRRKPSLHRESMYMVYFTQHLFASRLRTLRGAANTARPHLHTVLWVAPRPPPASSFQASRAAGSEKIPLRIGTPGKLSHHPRSIIWPPPLELPVFVDLPGRPRAAARATPRCGNTYPLPLMARNICTALCFLLPVAAGEGVDATFPPPGQVYWYGASGEIGAKGQIVMCGRV